MRSGLWYAAAHAVAGCIERQPHLLTLTLLQVSAPEFDRRVLQARVEQVDSRGCKRLKNQQLRLSWYDSAVALQPGDRVQVSVVLKSPRGLGNPGGFNYANWLRGKNYAATGYVKSGVVQAIAPLSSLHVSLDRQKYVHADLLNAMLLGQRAGVSADRWALFRDTGTIHLMVISGLHVGVFFGFVFLATSSLFRLLVLPYAWWVPRNGSLVLGIIALIFLVHVGGCQSTCDQGGYDGGRSCRAFVALASHDLVETVLLRVSTGSLLASRGGLPTGFLVVIRRRRQSFIRLYSALSLLYLDGRFAGMSGGLVYYLNTLVRRFCGCRTSGQSAG